MTVEMHHVTDDKSPKINFTESAVRHVLSYLQKNPQYRGIRLSVKKTGCSGLSYVVDFIVEPSEGDLRMQLNEHYTVCVDKESYAFLKNMSVDYVKNGLNYKFIFNNPNQKGQCGCGESFTV
jgi:iron-sulfur cluster assembly protein